MERKQMEENNSNRSPAGSTKSKSDITSYDGRKTTETDPLKELDEQEIRDYGPSGNSSGSSGSSNSSGSNSGRSTPSLGEARGGRDD
ncbi:hypothetical protein [Olleya sp. YS]|uniref:hypothetical protein n=1 Tax=Olleya sp. YS TaxID=3028318 RepID=UPI0024345B3D|nr:hypothetical protein [Olleya sp. YS]WGD35183.1 hypothetical protein Ollyesu_01925 [Olleya sp. YS]